MPREEIYMPPVPEEEHQIIEPVQFDFGLRRRTFVQLFATGLMIVVAPFPSGAQERRGRRGGRGRGPENLWERIHIGKDGLITLLAGKVEVGQGSRAEYAQAAAEELRVAADRVQVLMSDTGLTPNDGITAGSGSTPRTVPAIRQAAAAARDVLLQLASQRWGVKSTSVEMRDGKFLHAATQRTLTLGELAQSEGLPKAFEQAGPATAALTAVDDWKVMGTSVARPNARDLVTGVHRYASDIRRPDMLRGKVLRAPTYGAKLISVDLTPAKEMPDVVAIQDGSFIGVTAPTTFRAQAALDAIARTAKWEAAPQPYSKEIYDYLRAHVSGNLPKNEFAEARTLLTFSTLRWKPARRWRSGRTKSSPCGRARKTRLVIGANSPAPCGWMRTTSG